MLTAHDLGTWRDLLLLFTRYGRRDFHLPDSAPSVPDEGEAGLEPEVADRARAFAAELRRLGPAYVKFGQLLSTRPDVVPAEYIAALESLQDDLEPFSFADVERIVQEELGVRISKAFASFDATPVAAASLGQVHTAVLRDGREVVVKVQRPDVRERVRRDLETFEGIARELERHTAIGQRLNLTGAVEQAKLAMLAELDYHHEARNAETLARNLSGFPGIHAPTVLHDLSASRVLTTELVRGHKVSRLSPLALIEADYAALAEVLTRAYLKQICVDGIWHSDPHPRNVFLREVDGRPQIVLLDFGMVSRVTHEFQDEVIKLLLALSSNRGAEVADACVRMSEPCEGFDAVRFTREISAVVAAVQHLSAGDVNTGQLIFRVVGIAHRNALKPPAELTMLGKTLLHLDGITRKLDPAYDPQRVIRGYAEELMAQKLAQKFAPRNFYPALLDLNQLVLDLPHRAREIVDLAAAGRLSFNVKLAQAEELLAGIHKVANRITVGVVIAALLVSSSLMMRVPTRFTVLGVPGLAAAGYLLASVAGFWLVFTTLLRDRRDREKAGVKGR